MILHALMIILAADPTPRLTWYQSAEECRQYAAVHLFHYGPRVQTATCQAVRVPTLRPVTGEIVTR